MGPLTMALIGGAVIGLFKGFGNAEAKQAEFDDKKLELERSSKILEKQYGQAKEGFDLAELDLNQEAAEKKNEYNFLTGEVEKNRDTTLNQTAMIGAEHSEVNAMQIATLQVQAGQSEGAANQAVATSGFRNSGTAGNILTNTKGANKSAIDQARLQAQMTHTQTFTQAVNNYTSANQQMAAYQRQIAYTESAQERGLAKIDLQRDQAKEMYDLQGGYLTADLDTMNGDEAKSALKWSKAGSYVFGAIDGATSFYSIFK